MDYLYAKFGDLCLSRFGFTCGQKDRHTDRITESQRRMIANRYTDATTICVSNNNK